MPYFPPDVLNIDLGWLHIGAVGPRAITTVTVIVGAYFLSRLRLR
jgi:hypothetical protein